VEERTFISKLLIWKYKSIPQKYFVVLLSVLVGICSGIAASLLKGIVHFLQSILTGNFASDYYNYLYFLYPLIGILLSVWLVKKLFFSKDIGHGIPNVLYAISRKNGVIPKINMFNSLLTSGITVGFGGSTGLEGPTVSTSAAIASNIGRLFKVNFKTKTTLIGCAASAAMASMFNAPIAAIVFAIEVIMLDLTTASLIPLLMASVSAALTANLLMGSGVLFTANIVAIFTVSDVPFYALLGVIGGMVSLYFSNLYFYVTKLVAKVKGKYRKAIIGGLSLGVLMFFFPALYGEGYGVINGLISGDFDVALVNSPIYSFRENIPMVLLILGCIIFLKAIAMTITINAGGVGGIFAPTLFMGSMMGFTFSTAVNYFNWGSISTTNFTLVGMAGLMSGIMHAPLTAIFLIAEITGGYALFMPLMITTAIAFLTVKIFSTHSVYTVQLAKAGDLITHDKDQAVLTLMNLKSEIETDFIKINLADSLRSLVKVIANSNRNVFPVVDDNNKFLGVVQLNDIREIMFNEEYYDNTFVSDLMVSMSVMVEMDDNMDDVMKKFEQTQAWNLPVLEDGYYIGFVSKSKLFSAYRKLLKDFYQE
jgi:chloride channel protein, CIC family